jgi:hypothetical protein
MAVREVLLPQIDLAKSTVSRTTYTSGLCTQAGAGHRHQFFAAACINNPELNHCKTVNGTSVFQCLAKRASPGLNRSKMQQDLNVRGNNTA